GRGEVKLDAVRNVSAATSDDFGGVMQIFKTRVHARKQIRFLDSYVFSLDFRKRGHGLHFVRTAYVWNNRPQVEFKLDGVLSIRIGAYVLANLPPLIDVGVGVTATTLPTAGSRVF